MNPSMQAEAITGAGRGACAVAMFGAGWLGWGLGTAKAFNGFSGPAFGLAALALAATSIATIRKGRQLRRQCPADETARQRTILKPFLVVALIEAISICLVSMLAFRLARTDLATDWCAMVVGLHFLPLARIVRARVFLVLGVLIVVWCGVCWALFDCNRMAIAAAMGTGILLWGACVSILWRAQGLLRSARV
jgi:hypothetical protein